MDRKFFPLDKNYILRDAQATSKERLLRRTVEVVRDRYLQYYNPLGLMDDTILAITSYEAKNANLGLFDEFYDSLAGLYRFEHGSNQLELLFDGNSHQDKYARDWEAHFMQWVEDFCMKRNFIISVFEATVFAPLSTDCSMTGRRLKFFLKQYFDVNICHRRGYPVLKSA